MNRDTTRLYSYFVLSMAHALAPCGWLVRSALEGARSGTIPRLTVCRVATQTPSSLGERESLVSRIAELDVADTLSVSSQTLGMHLDIFWLLHPCVLELPPVSWVRKHEHSSVILLHVRVADVAVVEDAHRAEAQPFRPSTLHFQTHATPALREDTSTLPFVLYLPGALSFVFVSNGGCGTHAEVECIRFLTVLLCS